MKRRFYMARPAARWLSPVVGIGLLLIWQLGAMAIGKAYILPTPVQVLIRLWELRGPLLRVHLPATLGVTGLGLLISLALGVGLAVLMAEYPAWESALYPAVVTSQTIPTTAIAPLFVLWFGYGIWSKIMVTILITFFPIVINLHDGLKSVKREQVELFLTYGAGRRDVFFKLKVPSALPQFFASIKMAIPMSLIGAAIGEWLGGQSGLGYFSKRMTTQMDGAGVFAPIVLLSLAALLAVRVFAAAERRMLTWRGEI